MYTPFSIGSGLTRNVTFNGCICYVLYLHILRFYFVGQNCLTKDAFIVYCSCSADVLITYLLQGTTPQVKFNFNFTAEPHC